jgi:hypothetical protein
MKHARQGSNHKVSADISYGNNWGGPGVNERITKAAEGRVLTGSNWLRTGHAVANRQIPYYDGYFVYSAAELLSTQDELNV